MFILGKFYFLRILLTLVYFSIGYSSCLFKQYLPQLLYFQLILTVLLCINFVLYFLMVYKFTFGVWRDTKFEQNQMRNCRVFAELVFLMGINWASESVTFFVGWKMKDHWNHPALVFFSSINSSIGILMLIICFSKRANRDIIKNQFVRQTEVFDSHRTVSSQCSTQEDGFELTDSNNQLVESAIRGTSDITIQAGQGLTLWGYKDHNGPAKWNDWFPISSQGTRQSPIDIQESSCIKDISLSPLLYSYQCDLCQTIENDGNSWKVKANSNRSSLSGGPLDSEYRLVQYHAHWGSDGGQGSEHKVNGELYDGELHLVHYNSKYGSMGQALDFPDGLAVMAVFIKIGKPHNEFHKLCIILNHVQRKGLQRDISMLNLSPEQFLPENKSYFTYPGSLTTPPLSECITWLVFKDPVEISQQQMNAMRNLNFSKPEEDEDKILNNYRPTQPVGERKVMFFKTEEPVLHQQA